MGQDSMVQYLYEGSTLYWSDLLCPVWRINVFPIYLVLGTISEESCSFMRVMSLRHVWLVKHEMVSMLRAVCHGCKSKVYDRVRIIEYCLGTELRVKQWNTIMVLPAVEQSTSHDHVLLWSWSRCSHGQHSRTQSLLSGAAHSIMLSLQAGHCLHYNNLMSITQWTKHFYEPQLFS